MGADFFKSNSFSTRLINSVEQPNASIERGFVHDNKIGLFHQIFVVELFDFVPHLNSVESSDVVFVCGVGEVVDLNVVENGLVEEF